MTKNVSIPIIEQSIGFLKNIAIVDSNGSYTYEFLLEEAKKVASALLAEQQDLDEARVAFLILPNFDYVKIQWGIWLSGGIAVPLCPSHPLGELEYVIDHSGANILIIGEEFEEKLKGIVEKKHFKTIRTEDFKYSSIRPLPDIAIHRRGMMLYTSGTTSAPKGVVSTHENITVQTKCLVDFWGWQSTDYILQALPLHHTHGIINVLCSALWSGATCEMLPRFDPKVIWEKWKQGPSTLYMGVPTNYAKLVNSWNNASSDEQKTMSNACKKLRLMVSGSAALPVSLFETWKSISGHACLERYGMTEIGMALSNPLYGERRPGFVGLPLPEVSIRLVNDQKEEIKAEKTPGEIQVKGKNVFLEYWKNADATEKSFQDGWFCTGDIAVLEDSYYRILGRTSVDIIKSGGYKISALEIESVLLTHPLIAECAVVGIEDSEWGERVTATVVLQPNQSLSLQELRHWSRDHLAPYKIPSRLEIFGELPRNVMGKVTKPKIKALLTTATALKEGFIPE